MNKHLNIRLLVRVGAGLLLLMVLVHVVHLVQMSRHARTFREQGEEAARKQEYDRCALYLGRYLALRPDDVEVESQYGLALEKLASTPAARWRAYHVLDRVLRRAPDNHEVRQTLGKLAAELRRLDAAIRILEPLRNGPVDQAELEETLAWCYRGLGNTEQAIECFRNAIQHDPKRISSYEQLAHLLLVQKNKMAAEKVMEDLIRSNRNRAIAFVTRARYREQQDRFEQAAADFKSAVALADEDGVLLEAADFQRRRGRPDEARVLLDRAIHQRKDRLPALVTLVRLEQETGRPNQAVNLLRDHLSAREDQVIALLVELLLERGDIDEAEKLARTLSGPSPWTAWIEACRLMRQGRWAGAARWLEALAEPLSEVRGWSAPVQLALARCYEVCGDPIRRREACRRAVALDPGSRSARMALARAQSATGLFQEASESWKRVLIGTELPAEGWIEWASALTRGHLMPGAMPSDWSEVNQVLDAAERAGVDPVALAIARAEALFWQGRADQAEALLQKEAGRLGNPPALRLALADLCAARSRLADALGHLKDLYNLDARLARIRYVHHAGDRVPNAARVLEEAASDLERLPPEEAGRVLRALVELSRSRGDFRRALQVCGDACRLMPHDLRSALLRFDLAQRLVQDEEQRTAIAGLRAIEGESGLRWRWAEALRLLQTVQTGQADSDALDAAWLQLGEARRWSRLTAAGLGPLSLVEGRWKEKMGRPDDALQDYLASFEQGERAEADVWHLVQMLFERQRYFESDQVLRRCEREGLTNLFCDSESVSLRLFPPPSWPGSLTPALARLGCEIALEQKTIARALELAPRAVPEGTGNHLDQLWLAEVYVRASRPSEAIRVLEQLTAKSPAVSDGWLALLRQLMRTGQREKALDVFAQAQKQLSARDDLWQLALGQCCEVVGKVEQAERYYRLAAQASPNNPLVQRQLARFYLANDEPEKAVGLLRDLLASPHATPDQQRWAARTLAGVPFQLVVLRRQPSRQLRAVLKEEDLLALLNRLKEGKDRVAAARARALVIAAQPDRVNEGLILFEQTLTPKEPLTPDERLWLAQLHELAGNSDRADGLMEELLAQESFTPQYLAGQVRLLLHRGDRSLARPFLRRLQDLEPDAPRTRLLLERFQSVS